MPTLRLRRTAPGDVSRRLMLHPARIIAATTKVSTGVALPQANMRLFATAGDTITARDISSPDGTYALYTPDAAGYYVVALQDGTFDSASVTWDNAGITFDRATSVGGVAPNNLFGALP
jgi:hypothetical protein